MPLGITRFSFSGGTTTTTAIPISFRNSLGIVIGTYGAGNIPYTNEVVEIPLGTTQIIMNTRSGYVSDPQISFYRVNVRLSEQVSELIARPVTDSHWQGKAWASLGDSITAGSTWQPSVKNALSLTWTNFGVGGARISGTPSEVNAMCQDARINAIPTDVDLITLMGGTNDWAQSIPLGTITSTDPTTFYGALNTFAQKAFTRWPTKRITLATTPYGEIPAWESRSGWTSPAHNALGLTANDYAEAVKFSVDMQILLVLKLLKMLDMELTISLKL